MAGSRLERIGTIFSRTQAIIRSNAVRWEDRPLWYDLYEAFPPAEEPRYDRSVPNMKAKNIFYKEDQIRALLHNRNKQVGMFNMFNNNSNSLSKRFIEAYQTLEKQENNTSSEGELYEEAIELLQREREKLAQVEEEQISLVKDFKDAREKQRKPHINIAINVKDVFKD